MLKARKGNRVVKIPDDKKKAYIALGYSILDMDGNMVHEHVEPTQRLAEAEKKVKEQAKEIEKLKAENAELTQKLSETESATVAKKAKAASKAEKTAE